MSDPLPREEYTVGWVCALAIELSAAQLMLDVEHGEIQQDDTFYTLGSIGDHNIAIVCLPAGMIGNNPAAVVATQMQSTFKNIRFGLMVGVGAGVPTQTDVRLGDIVVSQPDSIFGGVVQYDRGKRTPDGFERTGFLQPPPKLLLNAITIVQSREIRKQSKVLDHIMKLERTLTNFKRKEAGPDILFEATYKHQGEPGTSCQMCEDQYKTTRHPRETGKELLVHYGTIASGNSLLRDAKERDMASASLGGVLCFEMEAAGLMNSFPCLVIRGICDYADAHKNKKWQPRAAAAAAAYAKEILSVIPAAAVITADRASEIVPRVKVEDRSHFSIPFERDTDFVEQDEVMKRIDQSVSDHSRVALSGIGGIGKSQVAIEYAYRYRRRYPDRSVFWIYAANASRFDQAYQDLSIKFQIPGRDDKKTNCYKLVHEYLCDASNGSWLMILDNADDRGTFYDTRTMAGDYHASLINYLPQCSHGKIIITTRDTRLGEELSLDRDVIQIPELDLPKSKAMLESRLRRKLKQSDEMVDELLNALDFLPLAISQAAAYVRRHKTSIRDYHDLLAESEAEFSRILGKEWSDPRRIGNSHAVFKTWAISFKHIEEHDPRAAKMLSLMAVLDRQGIQEDLVTEKDERRDIVIESLGTLKAFSLIAAESNAKSFTMHRLVQHSVITWLEHNGSLSNWQMRAISRLSDRVPDGEYESWELWGQLFPHARRVLEYECSTKDEAVQQALILNNFAWYEMRLGRYENAHEKGSKALEIRKIFLPGNDEAVLFTTALVALTLGYQGRIDEAITMQTTVLRQRQKELGSIAKGTLNSQNNLAWMYTKKREWRIAEKLFRKVLDGRVTAFGDENRQTITARAMLAEALFHQNRISEARELSAKAYEQAVSCKDLGDNHPDTLEILDIYAEALRRAAEWSTAEEVSRHALISHLKEEGKAHPATLLCMLGLEEALSFRGKKSEAASVSAQALSGYKALMRENDEEITDLVELRRKLQIMKG